MRFFFFLAFRYSIEVFAIFTSLPSENTALLFGGLKQVLVLTPRLLPIHYSQISFRQIYTHFGGSFLLIGWISPNGERRWTQNLWNQTNTGSRRAGHGKDFNIGTPRTGWTQPRHRNQKPGWKNLKRHWVTPTKILGNAEESRCSIHAVIYSSHFGDKI